MKERYAQLRKLIGQEFYQGEDPGEILEVSAAGDRHLHGESVTRLSTSGGRTLYYKPRDSRSTDLLGDLTFLLFGERMVPEQISGEGYAFQKAIENKLPETASEKGQYYERLGLLTALFYALGSTDMHRGNLLCADGNPVVIDTETLLCAKAEGIGGAGEFSVDYGEIFPDYKTSVGECMVLPRFYGYRQTSPLIPGESVRPEGYESIFIKGFSKGYRLIREKENAVREILESYAKAPFRYLLRSTGYYAVKILQYEAAKEISEKELVLESLKKGLSEKDLLRFARSLAWEQSCIREGDIPYFWLKGGSRDLMGDVHQKALVPEYLTLSPIEYAKWRIRRMNDHDLTVQTAYIRASLKHMDGWEHREKVKTALSDTPLCVREAIEEVKETLSCLQKERIPLADGLLLWHTPMIRGKVGSLFGLSEGFSGIAVFVHACAASPYITGEAADIARKLTAACFRDLAAFGEYLLDTYPEPAKERVISRRFNGGFDFKDGLSGFLWALKQVKDVDPERAERILKGFEPWHTQAEENEAPGDPDVLKQIIEKSLRETEETAGSTDCLEGGTAARAAMEEDLTKAGIILKEMVDRKKAAGFYQVFPEGRHQYFLPAFLRGNTGIAYLLLDYAHKSGEGGVSP